MTTESDKPESRVRDVAEKSVEQARGALGTLLTMARNTADAVQKSTNTTATPEGVAVQKGFGYAETNIAAIFDFAQKVIRAGSVQEAVKLQSEFVHAQAEIMKQQVEELQSLKTPPKTES
jgi:phasin